MPQMKNQDGESDFGVQARGTQLIERVREVGVACSSEEIVRAFKNSWGMVELNKFIIEVKNTLFLYLNAFKPLVNPIAHFVYQALVNNHIFFLILTLIGYLNY